MEDGDLQNVMIDAGFLKDLHSIRSQLEGTHSQTQMAHLGLLKHLIDMAVMEASELLEMNKVRRSQGATQRS